MPGRSNRAAAMLADRWARADTGGSDDCERAWAVCGERPGAD